MASPISSLASASWTKAVPVEGAEPAGQQTHDARAYQMVKQMLAPEAGPPRPERVGAWLEALELRVGRKGQVSVFEHSVLTFLLKQDVFKNADSSARDAIGARLRATLAASWLAFKGRPQSKDRLLDRLPMKVLRKASAHDRAWHGAAFIPIDRTRERVVQRKASSYWRALVPKNSHLAVGAVAVSAALLSPLVGQLAIGVLAMHAATSLHELVVHEALHPPPGLQRWIDKAPKRVRDTIKEHKVHHFLTFEKFTQMFSAQKPQARVDALIDKQYEPEHAATIRREGYASKLDAKGMLKLAPTIFPQTLIAAGVFFAAGMTGALPAVFAYAALYPVATGTVHFILHQTREERARGKLWVRQLADTSYLRAATVNHFMHHESPDHSNFNVCFPGADVALGSYLEPSFADLLKMDAEEVVYA